MGGDGRWIRQQGICHSLVPLVILLLRLNPLRLLVVLPWAGSFSLWAELTALETLDSRGETRMRLNELDAELIQAKTLQCLCTLHVSLYLIESIRNIVTSRSYRV